MSAAQIIKEKVRTPFVQSLIARKGWTQQRAADLVLEFVTSRTPLSFGQFMESAT